MKHKNDGPQRKERRKYVRSDSKNIHEPIHSEKRKYIRLGYDDDFEFTICTHNILKGEASSLNISQSGILFVSPTAPKMNSLILMRLHKDALKQCVKMEKLVLDDNGEVLGKVTRIIKDGDNYQIGVSFLTTGI